MKSLNRLLARSLPAITLFAWSAVLLYFYFSGRLNHYLIDTYRPFVLATGLLLPIVALGLLFTGRGVVAMPDDETDAVAFGVRSNGADAKLRPGQILAFLVLLLPVGAAAAVRSDSFSAKAIFNRGLVENSAGLPQSAGAPPPAALIGRSSPAAPVAAPAPASVSPSNSTRPAAPLEPPLPTADGQNAPATPAAAGSDRVDATQYLRKADDGTPIVEVVDLLFAADDPSMRPDFDGKKFEIVGQFLPDRSGDKMKFQIVRMFMLCCAADARPVAVTIEAPGTLEGMSDMSWVKVIGNAKFVPAADGRMSAVIKAQKILPTNPPAEIMLY
jgi:uncharacterized repeat protein (TIGR03943 family)